MPRTVQKVYYVRNYFDEFVSKFKRIEKSTGMQKYSFDQFKSQTKKIYEKKSLLNPRNIVKLFRQGTKKFFLKIFLYCCLAFAVLNSIKYFINRIFNRNADRQLKEALDLVKDLKKQNEDLIKYNMQFMERFGKNE